MYVHSETTFFAFNNTFMRFCFTKLFDISPWCIVGFGYGGSSGASINFRATAFDERSSRGEIKDTNLIEYLFW